MNISKNDIPVRIDTPAAVARQLPDFGSLNGTVGAEYFSMASGTDLAPLLEGLEGDMCQAAHLGYVLEGELVVTYTDRGTERCTTGHMFHWPAGHSVRADEDTEFILFSPQVEHGAVIDHIAGKVADAAG